MNKTLPKLSDINRNKTATVILDATNEQSLNDIAIIGMDLKFANADNLDEFWKVISEGRDCIRELPTERKRDIEEYLTKTSYAEKHVEYKQLSYLEHVDQFDYSFFRLSPKESSLMDPNQRLFLQCAYHAIEDAGYMNQIEGSNTGVYVGYKSSLANTYYDMVAKAERENLDIASVGNKTPVIASRIAYLLDLHGPNMVIDTACSSSLVALHLACRAILDEECDTAIVGSIRLDLIPLISDYKIGIESSDSHTKTFDQSSDGTGGGEGVAAVMIKSLKKAIEDKNHIYAVIRGSAVNQDGRTIGITAPSADAQEKVILKAWKKAGIHPNTIGYIEAHGTGTKLGDPIEIEALTKAFRRYTQRRQVCAIGSVKANLGHLDNCAGMAGLIKAVLMLNNRQIPPLAHFAIPNTEIDFWNSPFYISQKLTEWKAEMPRRCGISAFGLSGTNAHVILEEYVAEEPKKVQVEVLPFVITAKTTAQLKEYVKEFICYLEKKTPDLYHLCYTMAFARKHYEYRICFMVHSTEELLQKLNEWLFCGDENVELTKDNSELELSRYFPQKVDIISTPLYPFAKERCWLQYKNDLDTVIEEKDNSLKGISKAQKAITSVYEKVLGIYPIDVDCSLYELGGDSLIALKIVNLLKTQYQMNLDMSDVLVCGSIAALTEYYEKAHQDQEKDISIYSYLKKAKEQERYPLSSPQKRMFIMDWYRNIGSVYNMNRAFLVQGPLNLQRVKDVFQMIVNRHESLRTYFDFIDGEPVQIIQKEAVLKVEVSESSVEEVEQRVRKFFRKFDLKQAPLFRVGILKLESQKHVLILDMHHIISDGTSTGVIMKEFVELYEGRSLQPLPYHYRDYTMWQLECKKTNEMMQQMEYWRNIFKDSVPVLRLPYDYPRTQEKDFRGKRVESVIPEALTLQLRTIANEKNTSLHILLLCAYYILLAKYSNQEDIVVGVATSGRNSTLIEGNVGMFVNTLPIRTYPVGSKSLEEFLMEVTKISYEAYRNQDLQLDDLIESIDFQRDSSRNPLFDAVFTITKYEKVRMKELDLEVLDYDIIKARFDLIMTMCDYGNHIDYGITYATALFQEATIENMVQDYLDILQQLCNDMSIKIDQTLIQEMNVTNTEYNSEMFHLDFNL